jgi:hypothetical protein
LEIANGYFDRRQTPVVDTMRFEEN